MNKKTPPPSHAKPPKQAAYGRAPQEYGEIPPDELKAPLAEPGKTTKAPSILQGVTAWMRDTFGLLDSDVPSKLLFPGVQPVAEIYRPRYRIIKMKDDTAANTPRLFVTQGFEWELLSFCMVLTTNATVSNRDLEVVFFQQIDSGQSNIFYRAKSNFFQVASQSAGYLLAPHGIATAAFPPNVASVIYLPTPIGFVLPCGTKTHPVGFNIVTGGSNAGDILSQMVLFVRERAAAPMIEPAPSS